MRNMGKGDREPRSGGQWEWLSGHPRRDGGRAWGSGGSGSELFVLLQRVPSAGTSVTLPDTSRTQS